jgi:hypothetical protein
MSVVRHCFFRCTRAVAAIWLACLLAITPSFGVSTTVDRAIFSDHELKDGFLKTVFGVEHPSFGRGGTYVKKYNEPVRVYIHNYASKNRQGQIRRFIRDVDASIKGLSISVTNNPKNANFEVFVVDRKHYRDTIRRHIFEGRPAHVQGKCMVRVLSTWQGITKSQAVIVSDEGEFLFRRCMTEEILQGLGPLNDNMRLPWSVFNDSSPHSTFLMHDKMILNILYDKSIRPGYTMQETLRELPRVIKKVQKRFH